MQPCTERIFSVITLMLPKLDNMESFRRLDQLYSKAHRSDAAWKTDVNLDRPAALGKKVIFVEKVNFGRI